MEWKNITADFSDANGLMKTSSDQMYRGSKQVTDSITSVADMLRQEKIDKLNELALKHKQYIENQTLVLDKAKQKDFHLKTEADIGHLANIDENNTAETQAHISLYKNQGEALLKNANSSEISANAAKTNAAANARQVNISQERLAWQKAQAAQQRDDAIAAKEEAKAKEYEASLKSPGSVYFTFDENGNRVNHPGYVYGTDGKPMKESTFKTMLNINNGKNSNKVKTDMVNVVSKDLGINPKNLDTAVKTNSSKWFGNKPMINSRTYKDTVSTLTVSLNGDTNKVKSILSGVMTFDPKTGGISIPKQYVDNQGNFKSSVARKAFFMKAYYKAGMSYSEAAKKAGVRKNELNRLSKYDILGQNNE